MRKHTGNKYLRRIQAARKKTYDKRTDTILVDVYCLLEAYAVNCPAVAHAIKKLLAAGLRGKNDRINDLVEAWDAIERAIDLEKRRQVLARATRRWARQRAA